MLKLKKKINPEELSKAVLYNTECINANRRCPGTNTACKGKTKEETEVIENEDEIRYDLNGDPIDYGEEDAN